MAMIRRLLTLFLVLSSGPLFCAEESAAMAFWNAYDARQASLNTEIVREWHDDIGHYQLVRYDLGQLEGTNRSAAPKIAAYYGYPKGATASQPVAGILHIHGGGQRASERRVAEWVELGYAAISINWGAKVLEAEDTPNTDWDGLAAGFVRPRAKTPELTHHNLVRPDPHTLYKEPHILNSSWTLIAMSGRRALTFLEQQPVVDGEKLGVEGHSMGGRSTVLTAIDPRVKAASPSVGGSGFLYRDMWGLPGSARRMSAEDGLDLYQQVISCQSYWPHTTAPVMFLQGSNDFNAPNDLVAEGMDLLPESTTRMWAIAPHLNHRFTSETAAARKMWMAAHLKGDFTFPQLSASRLLLDTEGGVPRFEVDVDQSSGLPVKKVEIYYGYTRESRIRFWRSAEVLEPQGSLYRADCPVFDTAEPLFAFANITYQMPEELPAAPGTLATRSLTISSQYQAIYPEALQVAGVKAQPDRQRQIDDFSHGWRDWYRLSENNPHHWIFATRKIVDPTWMGPAGAKLAMEVETSVAGEQIAISIEANTWQGYTGRRSDTYHAIVSLDKAGANVVELAIGDFKNKSGQSLPAWDEAVELLLTPAWKVSPAHADQRWAGQVPTLANLRWVGGDLAAALPYPHQRRDGQRQAATTSFDEEFQKAIDDSVVLEEMDAAAEGGKVYLSTRLAKSIQSKLPVRDDQAFSGKPISIGGKTYAKGIGTHADSQITFALNGGYQTFHVVPGPDDGHRGRLELKILVDGEEVYTSSPTQSHDGKARPQLEISVEGAKELTLVVDSSDGNAGGDHASWGDAYLVK